MNPILPVILDPVHGFISSLDQAIGGCGDIR